MIEPAQPRLRTSIFVALLVLASSAGGCADGLGVPEALPEPGQVQTGIYSLESRLDEGSCAPPPDTGALGEVLVASIDEGLIVDHPVRLNLDATGTGLGVSIGRNQIPLFPAEGDAYEQRSEGHQSSTPVCPATNFIASYQLLPSPPTRFEVLVMEDWSVDASCPSGSFVAGRPSPAASCRSERTFTYSLVEACAPTCRVEVRFVDGRVDLQCVCPDDG